MENALLRQLLDIGRQMAETRALDPLLIYAVDVAITLLKAEFGYLLLVKPDGTFDFRVHRDKNGEDIASPMEQVSKTVIFRALEQEKGFVSANAVSEFSSATSINKLQLRSLICVPLIAHGKALGVIYLDNRQEGGVFSEKDLDPLQYLASHAAVCIENAMLYEELQAIAAQQHESSEATQPIPFLDEQSLERERMRVIYNFMQDASHQFRTPLAVINTNVDLLERKLNTDIYNRHLHGIRGQVRGIVSLVESLLMMVKLDSLNLENVQPYDLNRVAKEIFEVRQEAANLKHLDYRLETWASPIWVSGMVEYLRQALWQVLENAIQYTNEGGAVQLNCYVMKQHGIIEIQDSGIGIAKDDIKQIFRRFYRGDKVGTTRGMGLGLSIAQKIVLLHAGQIEVESQKGEGTAVRLIFPILDGQK